METIKGLLILAVVFGIPMGLGAFFIWSCLNVFPALGTLLACMFFVKVANHVTTHD